jgi:hypothetical protein
LVHSQRVRDDPIRAGYILRQQVRIAEAVMGFGARIITSRSATTATGAGQEKVCLKPSFDIEAPDAVYPSMEAAVATTM